MTREQELAASAARHACIAWLRNPPAGETPVTASLIAWNSARHEYANPKEAKAAFLAAWRTQWEAR